MSIDNRNLLVGTRLVARYKKEEYVCTVEAGENGEGIVFVLAGVEKRFKSPSAAGMHVMGGKAVNGWKFWSLEGSAPASTGESTDIDALLATPEPKKAKAKSGKGKKTIYSVPGGPNLGEGKSKWFCVACMSGFVVEGSDAPAACPEGHPMEDLNQEEVAK